MGRGGGLRELAGREDGLARQRGHIGPRSRRRRRPLAGHAAPHERNAAQR